MIEKITTGALFTNSYIIANGNECVIVDPGLSYKKAYEEIKEKYEVKAILLTHGHFDHVDGIQYYMDLPIYIHPLDEEFLYDSNLSLYTMLRRVAPFSKGDLDIRLVNDNDTFNLIGYEFKVIHTPGHTKGSVCYYFDNHLLCGDTLFNGSCGRVDFPTGNQQHMQESLKRIMNNFSDDFICYPGHNDVTTIGYERKNNPFIR